MNVSTVQPDRLDRIRRICLALPECVENEAHGDPAWRVRGKIFAVQKGNFEGGRPSVWFKAPEGGQAVLVGSAGDRFFVPPYLGHRGWVGAYLDLREIDWDDLEVLIRESYVLIAPKRLGAML